MFWKNPSLKQLLPPPLKAAHGEYSMIFSQHDDPARPTPSLLQLSLQAIDNAMGCDLSDLSARMTQPPFYPEIWPGEHYQLLAALIESLQPKLVIEIGTSTGLSALAMKKFLPANGRIVTFDIRPWDDYPDSYLNKHDFTDGRLTQVVSDLSEPDNMQKHSALLKEAKLFFIDATHDGNLEQKLFESLLTIGLLPKTYFVFDDIRVWTMLKMWRNITCPKIDLTSFGHWAGTGLVEVV